MSADYIRACAKAWNLDLEGLTVSKRHECACGCGSMRAVTFRDADGIITLSVPIPNHCKRAYDATIKRYRVAAGFARTSSRPFIRCAGITVPKRWNWTKQRDKEERDNIRMLSRDWNTLRSRLVGHCRTLEQYARNPL